MTAADEIRVLLDGYGPPTPSLLPWLARTAAPGELPQVARAAAAQALFAPMLRWPAVADAVAEVLAARAADRSVPEPLVAELAEVLPQMAAHLDVARTAALLGTGPAPRPEVIGYAALGEQDASLLDRARLLLPTTPWPEVLTAARTAAMPPLSNLRLLGRMAAGDPARPGALDGSESAYLLPYLSGDTGDVLEDVVKEIKDYLAPETIWYATALLARAAPYLGDGHRSRLRDKATDAPPEWAGLLRQLTERQPEPWPSTAAEIDAAHPAIARLAELTSQASDADQVRLNAEYARLTSQIIGDFGDPGLERWEPGGLWAPVEIPRLYIQPPELLDEDFPVPLGIPGDVDDLVAGGPPPRSLVGECPETVPVGKPFTLRAWIGLGTAQGAALLPFDVPAGGSDVVLVLTTTPGIRILGEKFQKVRVPRDDDSEWAEFSLQADAPGAGSASVVATLDGTYLGNLTVSINVRADTRAGPFRRVRSEVGMESVRGAVSLIARYSPRENLYRFQLITDDYPSEVRYQLDFDPADSIKDLIKVLNDLAEGRRVYSPAKAHRFLANKGMELWQSLLPEVLRDQFWDHQAGIEQLTIVSDNDDLPWEVLYPRDRGHGDKFLVEQFPVTRAIFDRSRVRGLRLRPARFVLPPRSPSKAADEVATLSQLLGETSPDAVVTDYDQLLELLENDDFGVLHFACHNTFDPVAGSAIKFGKTLFTPDDLTMIADDRVLEDSAPLVFVNACQAAGLGLSYNKLDGWATKFMAAGAAAFIGTLWAVTDETSTPFAAKVYSELSKGTPLGQAVLAARKAVSEAPADPTWLAYTVYGDPRATITSSTSSEG
jgi:hypothetical protein